MFRSLFANGIYSWLDLILLGWTLGLVWLGGCALAYKGRFACKVRYGLENERFLFGGWTAEARYTIGGWLFLAAVVLLQFDMFFMNSLVREKAYAWHDFLASKLETVYFIAIVLKLILFTRYSGWQLGVSWCFFFVSRWVFINNHEYWVITGILFALAAKDVPQQRTLKAGLAVSAASFFAVVLASTVNLIPTISDVWNNGRVRNSFGYGWYNLTGAILLGICIMYLCWRQVKNLKWFDFALLIAALVFCNQGPDSRAATVCIALLLALAVLLRFLPVLAKTVWVRALVSAAPMAALAASLLGSLLYRSNSTFWVRLDILFSGRLNLAHEALEQTTLAIAGQQLLGRELIVDNFYVAQWIFGGPVMSLLLWGAVTLLLWKLMEKGAVTESACLVVMLAHAFMEGHFIWPCINVCLWLLPCALYLLPAERTPSFAPVEKRV